ncbi:MAG: hypothetical protein ITD31_03845 [Nitrosospira sp.]|nr:hypothetical protein [Nitrosospira sp.]
MNAKNCCGCNYIIGRSYFYNLDTNFLTRASWNLLTLWHLYAHTKQQADLDWVEQPDHYKANNEEL